MKIMAYAISVLILISMANVLFAEEVEHFFPKENPIFSLSIPDDWDVVSSMFPNSWREWRKEDVQGSGAVPFQASPDFVQEGRLLITLWAFVPDAVADLGVAEQNAGELIAERVTDFIPAADTWEKNSINGIPFLFMDASGKEKAKNEAPVNVKAAFFNPEGTHVFLLMVIGSPEIMEKYEGEVQKIINSIKPGK
ncbi:MAG: hypothetical protein JSV17_09240 [Candidatus Aminicenantes bacterium]|nr:MAG: hypothetical protein JSV17_09240 [Candidatus Aminicenantes bacterium]